MLFRPLRLLEVLVAPFKLELIVISLTKPSPGNSTTYLVLLSKHSDFGKGLKCIICSLRVYDLYGRFFLSKMPHLCDGLLLESHPNVHSKTVGST